MRFGVAGTGHWARTVHIPVLAARPDVDLVAVWGRDAGRAAEAAAVAGCAASTDLAAFLARVDAVSVAVPPTVQAALATQAAEAGCHLLLEKPLATSLEAAQALETAVRRGGAGAVCFLTRRFVPAVRDFIAAARGTADRADATFRSGALLAGSPYAASPWRRDRLGAVWDVTPHALSVLSPLMGPVRAVAGRQVGEGAFTLAFGHAGGTSTLAIDLCDPADALLERYAVGDGGTAFENRGYDRAAAFGAAVDALLRGGPAAAGQIAFAVDTVAVTEAAARAVATGARQRVDRPVGDGWPLPAI